MGLEARMETAPVAGEADAASDGESDEAESRKTNPSCWCSPQASSSGRWAISTLMGFSWQVDRFRFIGTSARIHLDLFG